MMNSEIVTINTELTKDILKELDSYAKRHYEDRSTAIRQLLAAILKELSTKETIDEFRNNKLTVREVAQRLGVSYWEAQTILIEAGVPIQKMTQEEIKIRKEKAANDVY